ncbi:MAG: diacylglycerol/lipid kinase family protein [Erysipelotrichaceae bacterium]|jgi:diacylglycerol kinase (ATP)
MKYVFIVNPAAGKENSEKELLNFLKEKKDFDFDVYYTKSQRDATYFIKQYRKENPKGKICFVACGGDGTVNEVINGVYGLDDVSFGIWPCGSGNDYVKYYGGAEKFLNLGNLLNGEEMKVDVMTVAGRHSVNVVNFGFDCAVVRTMEKVKNWPILSGKHAYTVGVIGAVFTGRKNYARIVVDGELLNPDGEYLLCTIANGSYVGGSYNCAPRSVVNDGLMEVCMAKCMPLLRFVSLVGKYQKGLHLDDEKISDVIKYRQAKKVEIISDEEMDLCLDGEIIVGKHFVIENEPEAIFFRESKQ